MRVKPPCFETPGAVDFERACDTCFCWRAGRRSQMGEKQERQHPALTQYPKKHSLAFCLHALPPRLTNKLVNPLANRQPLAAVRPRNQRGGGRSWMELCWARLSIREHLLRSGRKRRRPMCVLHSRQRGLGELLLLRRQTGCSSMISMRLFRMGRLPKDSRVQRLRTNTPRKRRLIAGSFSAEGHKPRIRRRC